MTAANKYLVKNASWHPEIEGGTFVLLGESITEEAEAEASRIIHTRHPNYPDGAIEFLMQRGQGKSAMFAWVPMSAVQVKTPDGWQSTQQFQRFRS